MNRLDIPEDDVCIRSLTGTYVHGYGVLETKTPRQTYALISLGDNIIGSRPRGQEQSLVSLLYDLI